MPSERVIAELIFQLGRGAFCDNPGGLTPAQWAALRFFSRANRFSRTVSAFAMFHLTTKGTASQTVKSLVRRGFLARTQSDRDARSATLDLTSGGHAMLNQDPFETLVGAVARLSPQQRRRVETALAQVLKDVAGGRGKRLFGMCTTCAFLYGPEKAGPHARLTCRLVDEPLDWQETQQICINFEPRLGDSRRDRPGIAATPIEAQP
jgi:DNA-binding MarR family transcriptional regulator